MFDYTRHKERAAQRSRDMSFRARDIGRLPPIVDPDRRRHGLSSFQAWNETYLAQKFSLAWGQFHLDAMPIMQQCAHYGGLYAYAMPRGSGKTTLAESLALFAIFKGWRYYVLLIGSTEDASLARIKSLKLELTVNDLLAADFPEICYPIRKLQNEARRCAGQLHHAQPTHVEWLANQIVLPCIPGSAASAAIIRACGLTGQIRGALQNRPDGSSSRPDFVILDDPQTDASAKSPTQNEERISLINGAVLGLAAADTKIAAVMPCTVIKPKDAMDQILDRTKNPEWQGTRTKLMIRWPDATDLWDQYADLRAESLKTYGDLRLATEFYAAHRKEMDAGGIPAWPDRFYAGELSAIQHAYNLRLRDPIAYAAEFDNNPKDQIEDALELDADTITQRLNRHPMGLVPPSAAKLTGFIDVHANLLYWSVCAWGDRFAGSLIAYGAWPEQPRTLFSLRDAAPTITDHAPVGASFEGGLHYALERCADLILAKAWPYDRENPSTATIERCLIDANWGKSTDLIYKFCATSKHKAVLRPSHGKAFGPSSAPMAQWGKQPGDIVGLNWRSPMPKSRPVRHILFDTDYWKSRVADALLCPVGNAGAMTLNGTNPAAHRLLAEHLTSEYRTQWEAKGRRADQWTMLPRADDNHWWDCLVGCTVAASTIGITSEAMPAEGQAAPRVKFSEQQRTAKRNLDA